MCKKKLFCSKNLNIPLEKTTVESKSLKFLDNFLHRASKTGKFKFLENFDYSLREIKSYQITKLTINLFKHLWSVKGSSCDIYMYLYIFSLFFT